MYSGNDGQIFMKILPWMEIEKKNKARDKFSWVNQDLFLHGKNKNVEIKLKKTKLWYSSLKWNTYSNDFIQNKSKSFQATNFERKSLYYLIYQEFQFLIYRAHTPA